MVTRDQLIRTVSYQIYDRRLSKDLTMRELMTLVGSVDDHRVRTWECGEQLPNAVYLCRLADVLGCSVDELLGRTEPSSGSRLVTMPLPIGSNFKRLRSGGTSWPESMSHYTNLQPALMARGQASPGKEATIFFNYDFFVQDVQDGGIVPEG